MLAKSIKFFVLYILMISVQPFALAQDAEIHGDVFEMVPHDDHYHKDPLAGANVVWMNTTRGVATNEDGHFCLDVTVELPHRLVVSYIGYQPDTLLVESADVHVEVILEMTQELDEVTVSGRRAGGHVSSMEPVLTHVITGSEMQRAACCNLAEAFETNVSVDVTYSDAVSGAQQIQMLGLAGTYSQLLLENAPGIRGLGQPFGLSYVPGPWMESISISKGASSVINGYESITGQINVDYKKPEGPEMLYYNAFAGSDGQLESSLNAAFDMNDDWSAMLMTHGELFNRKVDHNNNSFLDHPMVQKYNVMNRYRYESHGKVISQFGFNVMQEEREGGQKAFYEEDEPFGSDRYYGYFTNTSRFQAFARTGFYFDEMPDASLGTQLHFTHHNQDSFYGQRPYEGEQNTFYANVLFANTLGHPDHTYTVGISYLFDDYHELLNDSVFDRQEKVPGAFAEYSYHTHEKLTATAGVRIDYHNIYGTFFTPRSHLHFNLNEHTTMRLSAGKGYRVPNLIAENTGLLVSSRSIVVLDEPEAEEAWNYGGSITRRFSLFGQDASFVAEAYRTLFTNQMMLDVDSDHTKAIFYNLDGNSYANNYQMELHVMPVSRMDVTAAFRFTDTEATIGGRERSIPFVNRYRGMVSGSYATRDNDWQFDLTAQFNGRSRLPDMPETMNVPDKSPGFVLVNTQVTHRRGRFEWYAGVENLTDYIQDEPILNAHEPFGDTFDGSMIWGPLLGRKFYAGLRFTLEK